MTFFSGFCLQDEAELFDEYLNLWRENPYVVAGFSYGAIKALEYTLSHHGRIDRLILLSPAWFVGMDRSFVRQQMIFYKKSPEKYIQNFYRNVSYPTRIDLSGYAKESPAEDLKELLGYAWQEEKLREIGRKGVLLEVYLGAKDRIVDANRAHDFFKNYATSYLFKPFGHLLR